MPEHEPAPNPVMGNLVSSGPEVLSQYIDKGNIFLVLDVPDKFTLGHDSIAFTVQDSSSIALGFRDVPAGPHFFWMAAPGSISRCGYWYVAGEKGEVRVKQWDRYNEKLGPSQFMVHENKETIDLIYPKLIPYDSQKDDGNPAATHAPRGQLKDDTSARRASIPDSVFATDRLLAWHYLTSSISTAYLNRVTGNPSKNGTEFFIDTIDKAKSDMVFPGSSGQFLKLAASDNCLDFLFPPDLIDVPHLDVLATSVSSTSTSLSLSSLPVETSAAVTADPSFRLLSLLGDGNCLSSISRDSSPSHSGDDLLAELQFSFVTGTYLGNFACLEHWWFLVLRLVLRAHHLVGTCPVLCRALLKTLLAQLVYKDRFMCGSPSASPSSSAIMQNVEEEAGDIFDFIPGNRSKFQKALTNYKMNLDRMLWGGRDRKIMCDLSDGHRHHQRFPTIKQDQEDVGRAFLEIEAWVCKYGWDLCGGECDDYQGREQGLANGGGTNGNHRDKDGDDDEEYAPVVVALDENGREVGLLSWE